jgi:hypothetical protein
MNKARLCLALLFLTAPAGSTTPCPRDQVVGEYRMLELLSVRVDGVSQSDLGAYDRYDVGVGAEALTDRLDGSAVYVRFRADRVEVGSFGREQFESLSEFYPTAPAPVPSPIAATGDGPE